MRLKLFCLLFIIFPIFAFSQNKSEKSFVEAKYKCVYSIKYIINIEKMTHGTEDQFVLLISDDLAYGDSFLRSDAEAKRSNPETSAAWSKQFLESFKDGTNVNYYSSLLMFACIYKDYKENKIKVIDKISGSFFFIRRKK